jgi:hypothetical protein
MRSESSSTDAHMINPTFFDYTSNNIPIKLQNSDVMENIDQLKPLALMNMSAPQILQSFDESSED